MKYILVFLGIAVIYTILNPSASVPKDSTHQPRTALKILAFGDSLTYGHGAKTAQSYPAVLAKKTGLTVVNAGINGHTSGDGLRRLRTLLDKHRDATHVILWFGGNDVLQKRSLATLKSNLKQMISIIKKRNIEILLLSVPDFGVFGFTPLSLYEEVSDETGTPLLSGVLGDILDDPSLKSDQIHPNAKGYSRIANVIYDKLKEIGWL